MYIISYMFMYVQVFMLTATKGCTWYVFTRILQRERPGISRDVAHPEYRRGRCGHRTGQGAGSHLSQADHMIRCVYVCIRKLAHLPNAVNRGWTAYSQHIASLSVCARVRGHTGWRLR